MITVRWEILAGAKFHGVASLSVALSFVPALHWSVSTNHNAMLASATVKLLWFSFHGSLSIHQNAEFPTMYCNVSRGYLSVKSNYIGRYAQYIIMLFLFSPTLSPPPSCLQVRRNNMIRDIQGKLEKQRRLLHDEEEAVGGVNYQDYTAAGELMQIESDKQGFR